MGKIWPLTEKSLWTYIIVMNVFRLLFVPTMGLMPQGAYYFFYSEHLDWSYYDHPPMVAYMLFAFSSILGKSAWVVKLASWTMALGTQYLFFQLARKLLDQRSAVLALAIFVSTTMLSIISLVVTPDVPLLFFWTLSLLLFYLALFEKKWWAWLAGGLVMGLAFDSKYTAIFLPACLFSYLILSTQHRKKLLTVWPYLAVALMVIGMWPVIYWNMTHDFASFGFQGAGRAQVIAEEGWKPTHILGSIANQSIVLVPTLLIAFLVLLPKEIISQIKAILSQEKVLFVLSFFLPVFGAFMALSFVYWVKLNWIMPAYIAGCIYAVRILKGNWLKWQFIISIFFHVVLAVQVWFYVVPIKSDDTWYGWDQLAEEVEKRRYTLDDVFVFAGDHYKTTAELGFYMDSKVYSHNVIGRHAVQYDFVDTSLVHLIGKDAIYIDSDPQMKSVPGQSKYPEELDEHFEEVTEQAPIEIKKGQRIVRIFRVFVCKSYLGLKDEE